MCNLKTSLEIVEQEIINLHDEIDKLNKKIDLQELIIALRDKEIYELNQYIDPDCEDCCEECCGE